MSMGRCTLSGLDSRTDRLQDWRVTVMGLGRHGGGVASAAFFASRGARVTVTDLRTSVELSGSMQKLEPYPIRYVLGEHRNHDFIDADLIIKNPAVPSHSPYLALGRRRGIPIETDVSIFLRCSTNPVLAVTGTKGKSTVASAIHHGLARAFPQARLGGNITVSPLTFLSGVRAYPDAPVVLELSSWQLGDLRDKGLLKPVVSVLTILFPDHMNTYASMEEYIEDKKVIFQEQDSGAAALFNHDDPFQADFHRQTAAHALLFSRRPLPPGLCGAFLVPEGGRARLGAGRGRRLNGARESEDELILPRQLRLCGEHNRLNLLASALALSVFGVEAPVIREAMGDFGGVEHRLELFAEHGGVRFYNDSAATVPEAAAEALRAVPRPVVLIAGGTDKKLDFSPLLGAADIPERIVLLEGSGSEKIVRGLEQTGRSFEGPFSGLQAAVDRALELARPGGCVLFSPGCTSFEMFENEFDRGARFKAAVSERIGEQGR